MKKITCLILIIILLCTSFFSGCSDNKLLDPKKPITLTMWHNFGGQMQLMMDSLIDEFNSTVGKDQGIIINVTAISSSLELQEKLNMIVNEEPGSPDMPDLFTCYPKTAILFKEKGMLANLNNYFTEEELADYVPAFLEEGKLSDGNLYVFPFAKSTEILYVNQTLFNRFSKATGVTMECFNTFEDIADAANKYYEWSGKKAFFSADSWFNLAQAGMLQQGSSLFDGESLSINNEFYNRIWNTCYLPAMKGGFAIYDGYSSDLSKTGDLICSIGSSAGILFYGDTITYPDNTVETVEYTILPYPVFSNGKKVAIQRGNGFSVAKSEKAKEYAASIFLKWFTQSEQNLRFIESTGYLPVTKDAFDLGLVENLDKVQDKRIQQMLTAALLMYNEYEFFIPPVFTDFDRISKNFETKYKLLLKQDHEIYIKDENTDLNIMSQNSLSEFQKQ